MATTNNPLHRGLSGKLGDTIVFKDMGDETIVANVAAKRKFNSPKQDEVVSDFTDATRYAKAQCAIPVRFAMYQKKITKKLKGAYNVAIADYLNPPVIHELEANSYTGEPGQLIRVRATDDFGVASVKITIIGADDRVIEEGEAAPRGKRGLWRLTTTTRNVNVRGTKIIAVAKDYASNAVTKTLEL